MSESEAKPKLSFEEQKRKILEYEKYTDEMVKRESEALTKSFDLIFQEDAEPIKVYVPELDCNILFRDLTAQDIIELENIENDLLRGQESLFRMWRNGDKTVDRAKFDALSLEKKNYILAAIYRKLPFQSAKKEQQESSGKTLNGRMLN